LYDHPVVGYDPSKDPDLEIHQIISWPIQRVVRELLGERRRRELFGALV
jgi:hypothetical protein